jgi:hypothetical protein
MWRVLASVLLTLFLLGDGRPALAGSSMDWVVRKLTGTVTYAMEGGNGIPVEQGDFLAPGMSIQTAADGRVRLERGVEWLVVVPNSRVTILLQPESGMESGVRVEFGRIGVHIQKRSGKHFSVGAPNLVAVVKGTTFTVRVAESENEVEVREGLVEVSARASGETADVGAGQIASVKSASLSLGNKNGEGSASKGTSAASSLKVYPLLSPDNHLAPAGKVKGKSKSKSKKSKSGKNYGSAWSGGWSDDDDDDDDNRGRGRGDDDDDNSGSGGGDDDDDD